jgi:ribose 1,5-bisphosphokinase
MTGKLIYLMGPSGSGKDSLLRAAREQLESMNCRIAQRVITRSAEATGEDAVAVTPVEFEEMRERGAFALHWRANGLGYGIPSEINTWLESGQHVLVNGSREFLPKAQELYPRLEAVLLSVNSGVLSRRLLARGRESLGEIEARMARNSTFRHAEHGTQRALQLDNSGTLDESVKAFVSLVGDAIGSSER